MDAGITKQPSEPQPARFANRPKRGLLFCAYLTGASEVKWGLVGAAMTTEATSSRDRPKALFGRLSLVCVIVAFVLTAFVFWDRSARAAGNESALLFLFMQACVLAGFGYVPGFVCGVISLVRGERSWWPASVGVLLGMFYGCLALVAWYSLLAWR